MRALKVIVTACGAPGGPGIIKALRQVKERGIRIIGTDVRPIASGLLLSDEAYVVPHGQSKLYISAMSKLVEKTRADVILPLSSLELLPLSKNIEAFNGTKVIVNKEKTLEIALNKKKCYDYLKTRNIPVPNYIAVQDFEELKEAAYALGYPENPVCFKPPISKGQRGFRILRRDTDLKKLLLETKPNNTVTTLESVSSILSKGFEELLVMEYLSGPEYSVDSLVKNGESLIIVPRKRVETKLGISSVGVVERNEQVTQIVRKINEIFKFDYNINVQLKYSADGTPKLVEINPRVSGTICLSSMAGPNLPYLAIKLALRENFSIPKIDWGTTMVRCWDELYVKVFPSFPKIEGY
jgi:carbamoyl-phosphate synthase large subunit